MKIMQMKAFHELMLTGSVSEAARNLNRSQPAISALIAGLEDDLGMKLFERRNGRLHPVPEAQYLQEECAELLGRINTLQQNMQGIKELDSGKLELVSMPGPSVFLLPNLIADFAEEKPEIESVLISRSSDVVFQLVSAQQYDLGIADYSEGKAENTSLVREDIFEFDCLCALHSDDPFAVKDVITPKDLEGRPLASLYSDHDVYDKIGQAFAEQNVDFRVNFTSRYFIPLFTYVERKLAYAIVDPIAMESYRLYKGDQGDLVFRPMMPSIKFLISVLTPVHRPAPLITQSFTKKLKQEMVRLGGRLLV
ncbi:MAG: LysR substrate-binding domain-containing protein [Pseudomonadota bacterium]